MKAKDLEEMSRAVAKLIDGITESSGESRWYVSRLVVDEAQKIVAAEYQQWFAEKCAQRNMHA